MLELLVSLLNFNGEGTDRDSIKNQEGPVVVTISISSGITVKLL